MRLNKKMVGSLALAIGFSTVSNSYADLIPTNDNTFYYKMGGGRSVPVPAYDGARSIPLRVEGDVGLGYNCGVFNPQLSITNSLNGIKNSLQNMQQTIVNNATSAITQFPMYSLARADPDLYNLLNNGLLGAQRDLDVSTKSCQAMQSEIAHRQNPYHDWASISMGNHWKYRMSLANDGSHRSLSASPGDIANSDINLVKQKVEADNGDSGVMWVHGANIGRKGIYAGGKGQPAIYIVRDAAMAGYNVILQSNRAYDEESAPPKNNANEHLVSTWASPKLATGWITNVLGDEKVTTYQGGDKQSSPGVGLLPDTQKLTVNINEKLQNLVSGKDAISIEKLQAISAPGVMVNTAVITAIRQHSPVTQAILVDKLSQEIATSQIIDKALLARQMLQEGSQVPAIYGNHAAQETIKQALSRLNQEMENLLFNVKVRKALVSDTVSQLLNQTQLQQTNRTLIQPNAPLAPLMNYEAIQIKKQGSAS